jgi:hypothetical protein
MAIEAAHFDAWLQQQNQMKTGCNLGRSRRFPRRNAAVAEKIRWALLLKGQHRPHRLSLFYHRSIRRQSHIRHTHMKDASHPSPQFPPGPLRKAKEVAEQRNAAHELAITALAFIAAAPDELSRFLALTGIDPGAIRAAASEPGFLGGVLAYIAGNERTLMAFASNAGVAPGEVEKARIVLAGTD